MILYYILFYVGLIDVENIKIKNGFMLREIVDQWVVVPLGERVVSFNEIMTLSESGALLWKMLEQGSNEKALVDAILKEYAIDNETALGDIREFIAGLKEKGLVHTENHA